MEGFEKKISLIWIRGWPNIDIMADGGLGLLDWTTRTESDGNGRRWAEGKSSG
jgi:hypothetical protein